MFSPAATSLLAIGVLAGLSLSAAGCAAVLLRRSPFTPVQSLLYAMNVVVARLLWGARISGRLPVAADRGAVIVCNHCSSIDPCFIALATTRVVHWMVAKEYWRLPGLGWFFRTCEAISVDRGGMDAAATKSAIRLAARGGLIGMFPEGRINTTGRVLLPGRPGAVLIALKARVPIVPCYVQGSPYDGTFWSPLLMRAAVRLTWGRPMDLSEFYGRRHDRGVLKGLTERVLAEIALLAGEADFRPELAGRSDKPGGANGNRRRGP